MSTSPPRRSEAFDRAFAAAGAVLTAAAVGLGAYAAHGADAAQRARLETATLYLLVHGVALVALRCRACGRIGTASRVLLLGGALLFCGSLAGAAFFNWSTGAAPLGGVSMMLGWLAVALALVLERTPPR